MKKLHKAIEEYKFYKLKMKLENTFLVYNNLNNNYFVYIYSNKEFIKNKYLHYNVY